MCIAFDEICKYQIGKKSKILITALGTYLKTRAFVQDLVETGWLFRPGCLLKR